MSGINLIREALQDLSERESRQTCNDFDKADKALEALASIEIALASKRKIVQIMLMPETEKIRQEDLPEGWRVDPPSAGLQILVAPGNRGMVTVDTKRRSYALGGNTQDWNFKKKYKGAGWFRALVSDAVAELEAVFNS